MFPVKNRKFTSQAPITMRMMGLPGSSPLTTIGLQAMTMDRESMNYALNCTGYLTFNQHDMPPFMRYDALLLMLYKYYSQTRRVEGEIDSAFLRAAAEMTATWRYKHPVTQRDVLASQKWVLEVISHIKPSAQEIKNVWGKLFDRFLSSLSEPAVEMDDTANWWTAHYYNSLTEIPSYCLQLWMSKMLLPKMRSISAETRDLASAMLSPNADTHALTDKITAAQTSIRSMSDTDIMSWFESLRPRDSVNWWELQCVACYTDTAKLHNSAIFLAVSAMGKTGSVTANWLENRRARWGDAVRATIDDDLFTGTQAIRAYFERNHPLETEIEGAYQFLASTYFAAKTLNNQAVAWMIEQSRNHNISAAVAFATLILDNDYISLTALMRKIPKIQFDNLLKVMLYAIQDPYANYIIPKIYSSQYKDLASIGTIYLNAANATSNRQHLTHKALDISRRAAIERELQRLIKAKGEAEASLYFDNTTTALKEMGYARFHQDGDSVYLDPAATEQVGDLLNPNQDVGSYDELQRQRRSWPAEARSYSPRAIIVPYAQICEKLIEHETDPAKAYKNILGAFSSACEQVSMTTIKVENNVYKFVSRVTPLSAQVRQWVLAYDAGFDIPIVQPPPIIEMAARRTTEEYFKILFHPLILADLQGSTVDSQGFPALIAGDSDTLTPREGTSIPNRNLIGQGPSETGGVQEAPDTRGQTQQEVDIMRQALGEPSVDQASYLWSKLVEDESAPNMLSGSLTIIMKTLLMLTPDPPASDTFKAAHSRLTWGPWLGDPNVNDAKLLSFALRALQGSIHLPGIVNTIAPEVTTTLIDLLNDVCSRLDLEWVDLISLLVTTVITALKYKSAAMRSAYAIPSLRELTMSGEVLGERDPPAENNIITSGVPSIMDEVTSIGLGALRRSLSSWASHTLAKYRADVDAAYRAQTSGLTSDELPEDGAIGGAAELRG